MHFLPLLTLASCAVASPGFVRLHAPRNQQKRLLRRADNVDVDLSHDTISFEAALVLSSNNQQVTVEVDTNQAGLWVMGSDVDCCAVPYVGQMIDERYGDNSLWNLTSSAPGNTTTTCDTSCSQYGTFDTNSSDSFRANGSELEIEYGNLVNVHGIWGADTVRIGDTNVTNVTFGVASQANVSRGRLGIGFSTTSETFADTLKSSGAINSASYSLFLNESGASLLFGALDHNRYTGDLSLFPLLEDHDGLQITLDRVTMSSAVYHNNTILADGRGRAVFSSSSVATYMPSEMRLAFAHIFNMSQHNVHPGGIANCMDCDLIAGNSVTFNFQGVDIDVPLSTFMLPILTESGDPTGQCGLMVRDNAADSIIFGENFLRSVYLAVDLDNQQLAIAHLNPNSTSEDLEVISSSIPGATSAPGWNNTYGISSSSFTQVPLGNTPLSTSTSAASSTQSSSGSTHVYYRDQTPFSLDTLKLGILLAATVVVVIM